MDADQLYSQVDWADFLQRYCSDELGELWRLYPEKQHVTIEYMDLVNWNHEMADVLLGEFEGTSYKSLQKAIERTIRELDNPVDCQPEEVEVRFVGFGSEVLEVGEYWAEDDLGKYRAVSGQVSNATEQRPVFSEVAYECQRDGNVTYVVQEDDAEADELQEPYQCDSCERQGPFKMREDLSSGTEYQKLRLKLPAEDRNGDASPELDVILRGRVVREADEYNIQSGSRVTVAGLLTREVDDSQWILQANSIQADENDIESYSPDEDEREEIEAYAKGEHGDPYEILVKSIAPSLKGTGSFEGVTYQGEEKSKLWWIKLSAALCGLFRGWRRPNGDGTYQRGASHWFGIGDPSTGKSTILDTIESISPRSAAVSGKGASAAGLTAAAVNNDFDGSNWTLEAGALVQAHGGVACIDELDKVDSDAVSSLHGALEKQRVEVSKAGINASIPCETSVMASANPKHSRWSKYGEDSVVEQMDVVDSLLDRFDVIWTFHDQPEREQDEVVGGHIVDTRIESGKRKRGDEYEGTTEPVVDEDVLRKWVALSRDVYPVIENRHVRDHIVDYYVEIRNESGDEEAMQATTRTLEAILRLSEAAARVELSSTIEKRHVELAIGIQDGSLMDIGVNEDGERDIDMANGRESWTQQQMVSRIKGIVGELEGEDSGVEVGELYDVCESAGMDRDRVENVVQNLRNKAELYSPPSGGLKRT